MVVSINMTKEEKRLATDYAKRQGLSLSKAMKTAFFDRIEEEYDVVLIDTALAENKKNPKTYNLEEIERELGR